MSAIFKFRISGQGNLIFTIINNTYNVDNLTSGKQFYGDGIALWITQDSYYTEGDLHG